MAFPAAIELSSLDCATGFQINGEAAGDQSGISVASAGDVNGDGFADVIIGASPADPFSGASYVVFGNAAGFAANLDLSTLDGAAGFQINGEAGSDFFGFSVSSAGDVNGDGFADLIIGNGAGPNSSSVGGSYVVFGKAAGFAANLELSTLDGATGFQINGERRSNDESRYDYYGYTVSSAGDVNGDGFADLIIGATAADPNGRASGASYVVFGKAAGFAADLELSTLDGANGFQINGEAAGDFSGSSVASAGDVNGDGFADLIIGASGVSPSGASYVVFGKAAGFAANLELSTLDGATGFEINGARATIGRSVASAGDVNGDGFADLIIGADGSDPNGSNSGASYVVFGKAAGFAANLNLSTLDGSTGFQINGEAAGDFSGSSVASAGDVNSDGFADLIIGAEDASPNGFRSGASYVVLGKAAGFAANLELSTLDGATGFQINGEVAREYSSVAVATSVASAGDVNGDGFADMIIGARYADPNGDYSGSSYVVFGRSSQNAAPTAIALGDNAVNESAANASLVGALTTTDPDIGDQFTYTLLDNAGGRFAVGGANNNEIVVADGLLLDFEQDQTHTIRVRVADSGGLTFDQDLVVAISDVDTEIISGDARSNTIAGGAGDDEFFGASGADTLIGGDGGDRLSGGSLADTLIGGEGSDTYVVDGLDIVQETGLTGVDTVQSAVVSIDLSGGAYANVENIKIIAAASLGARGDGSDNKITGNNAANALFGAGGADRLIGLGGDDVLEGGADRDLLTGGAGGDTFVFTSAADSTTSQYDRIVDFTSADLLDFTTIDANGDAADGVTAFIVDALGDTSFARGHIRQTERGNILQLDINLDSDATPEMRILLLGRGGSPIDQSDLSSPVITSPVIMGFSEDTGQAGDGITADATPLLSGTSAAGVAVEILRDGDLVGATIADSTGHWSFDTTEFPFADGTFALTARSVSGGTSAPFPITIDTTPPNAPSVNLARSSDTGLAGDFATSNGTAVLVGSAEFGTTIELVGTQNKALVGNDGRFSLTGVDLTSGANAFTVRAVDAAGNVSDTVVTIERDAASDTPDPVLTWNKITLEAIRADGSNPVYASRALALESIAVLDALNAIDGTPAALVGLSAPAGADPTAALVTAAHDILSYLYPALTARFDAQLQADLGRLADGAGKDAGIALGAAVADAIVALRDNDGWDVYVAYDGTAGAGQWRPTPPAFEVGLAPQWADLTPFALESGDQFRPGPPPALDSAEYAAAVEEVRLLGSGTSSIRTADQLQTARFWADGQATYTPAGHWNNIAADIAGAEGLGTTDNAKLLATLNIALADAGIAAWDAKYFYTTWRPITAIREADTDGNLATIADPDWQPLLLSPPFPEYVSGHSTFSWAAAEILSSTFGLTQFSTTSIGLPGVTRSFDSFEDAATEAGRSRIFGGIHFEFANQAGQQTGRQVADWVLDGARTDVDVRAPVVLINETTGLVTDEAFTLTGFALDNLAGLDVLTYRLDNGAATALAVDSTGRFALPVSLATDGSADGRHVLTFAASDAAGNTAKTVSYDFTIDTAAPTVTLDSLVDGAVLSAGSILQGVADGTGSDIVQLSYQLGSGGPRPINFDPATGSFSEALDLSALGAGATTLTVTATDSAGLITTKSLNLSLAAPIPFAVAELTPADGAGDIGVTYRPQVTFTRPADISTINENTFYATDASGAVIPANVVASADGTKAWLFFDSAQAGSSTIKLHLDGQTIKAAVGGQLLDGDGDGVPGGELVSAYTTVSQTILPNTSITGFVVGPGLDLKPMTFDDMRLGPDQAAFTADDVFLNRLEGVKVFILGFEDQAVFTDAQGNFTLTSVPAGSVKLAIDGRTATNAPAGQFFPEMVIDLQIRPGQVNTVSGSKGALAEQLVNQSRGEVYLPQLSTSILTDIADTGVTVVTTPAVAAPNISEEWREQIKLVVQPGVAVDEHGNVLDDFSVGISLVPPELVRDELPPGVLQHTFDLTIQAPGAAVFTTPLELTLPNVFNAAPGTKLNFLSFDHTTGKLVIEGTATVSADGMSVTTDPGQGITKPGWHGVTPPGSNVSVPCFSAPPPMPSPQPQPDCDFLGVSLSAAGLALGGAGLLLGSTATPAVLVGIGLAATAVSIADTVRSWTNADNTQRAEAITGIGGQVAGIGAILQARNPTTVTTITGVGPSAGLLTETVGSVPSSINKIGGNILGVLGVVLSGRDLYNRGVVCYEDFFGNEQQSANNRSTVVSAAEAITPEIAGNYLSNFIDRHSAAASEVDAALAKLFSTALSGLLPNSEVNLILRSNGNKIEFTDFSGNLFKNADGTVFNIDIVQALSGRDLSSPEIVNAISELSDAFQSLSEAYGSLADADQYIEELKSTYADAAASIQADNTSPQAAPEILYFVIRNSGSDAVLLRGTIIDGIFNAFLPENSTLVIDLFDPATNSFSRSALETGPSGTSLVQINGGVQNAFQLFTALGDWADSDDDDLFDLAEFIVGTNSDLADSDSDGVSDFAEIKAGTNPLDGLPVATGVLAAVTLTGETRSVTVENNVNGAANTATAFAATGSGGLAIIDVTAALRPVVLAELDLPGTALDVAVAAGLGIAAVAAGAGGLHLIDVSDLTAPRLIQTISVSATEVEILDGAAIVAAGGTLRSIDLTTGEELQALDLAGSATAVAGLAREGAFLYVIDALSVLHAIESVNGVLMERGSINLFSVGVFASSSDVAIKVGDGVAYIPVGNGFTGGYATINIADPSSLTLISGPDATNIAGTDIALNGSGLAVVVGSAGGQNAIDIVRADNPADTGDFVTRVTVPTAPTTITIGNGLAFVGAGNQLQVVNYLAFDTQGVAPTATLVTPPVDIDPVKAGIQLQEGQAIPFGIRVTDDVQVRDVELLVNGVVQRSDGAFPFDLRAALPTIVANGSNTVTLQARARDTGGNVGLSELVTVELVADTVAPTLVSSNVVDGAQVGQSFRGIRFTFSEALDEDTVTAANFRLIGPGGLAVEPTAIQLKQGGAVVQVTYPLLSTGSYQLELDAANIVDRAGNALGVAVIETTFNVGDFSIDWIEVGGGSFTNAANWSGARTPVATDDAIIALPVTETVFLDFNETAEVGRLVATNTFEIRQGAALSVSGVGEFEALIISGRAKFDGATTVRTLNQSAAGVIEGAGNLTITNSGTIRDGGMIGSGVTRVSAGATLLFGGDAPFFSWTTFLGRDLIVEGTVRQQQADVVLNFQDFNDPLAPEYIGNVTIASGGRYELVEDSFFVDSFNSQTLAAPKITNAGTFVKLGNIRSIIFQGIEVENSGSLIVQSGDLIIDGTLENTGVIDLQAAQLDLRDAVNSGSIDIDAGATVNVTGQLTLAAGSTVTGPGLVQVNGTLTASVVSSLSNLLFQSGTLTGAGDLTISSSFAWTGGIMTGSGATLIAAGATATIGDPTSFFGFLSRDFVVSGSARQEAAVLYFEVGPDAPGAIDIRSGGSYEIVGEADISQFNPSNGYAILNAGTFVKSGDGVTSITGITFTNTGAVDIQAGTLSLDGDGSNAGSIEIDAGATLDISTGTFTLGSTSTLTGPGALNVNGTLNLGGTVTNIGPVTVAGTLSSDQSRTLSTISLSNGGTLTGAGDLMISSSFAWTGGIMTGSGATLIAAGATATIGDPTSFFGFLSRDFVVSGSARQEAAVLYFEVGPDAPGAIDIRSGGSYEIVGEADISQFNPSNGYAILNAGTFVKSGDGVTSITGITFTNTGAVDIQAGTLSLDGDGSNAGSIEIDAGATLDISTGTFTLGSTSTLTGPGALNVNGTLNLGGTVTNIGPVTVAGTLSSDQSRTLSTISLSNGGTLTGAGDLMISSSFAWTGGIMTGSGATLIAAGATATIGDPTSFFGFLSRDFVVSGSARQEAAVLYFEVGPDAPGAIDIRSGGSYEIVGEADISQFNPSNGYAILNAGTFVKSGDGVTSITGITFTNTGAVDIQAGTLSLDGDGSNAGSIEIDAGATLDISTGTFTLGSTSTLTGPGALNVNGTLNLGGTVTNIGPVTVAGTLSSDQSRTLSTISLSNGGTLTGAGDLTISSSFAWTGGIMTGSGATLIAAGATATIGDPTSFFGFLSRDFVVSGSARQEAAVLYFEVGPDAPGAIDIRSGGSYEIVGEADISQFNPSNGYAILNAGKFVKSGDGVTSITGITFTNAGTVDIQAGTLSLDGDGSNAGSIEIDAGATLDLAGAAFTLQSGSSIVGAGLLRSSATLIAADDASISSVALQNGTLTGSGDVTVTSSIAWTGGSMTGAGATLIAAAATATLGDTGTSFDETLFLSRNLIVSGSARHESALLYFGADPDAPGVLDIRSGGSYEIVGEADISQFNTNPDHAILNAGIFVKSGDGVTSITGITFTNDGMIVVENGDLHFDHLVGTGSIDVKATARLFLNGDFGGVSNDVLAGSNGTDILDGRSGDDSLIGGAGSDTLTGGAGSDSFVFRFGHGADVITDFGDEDLITLSTSVFSDFDAVRMAMAQVDADVVIRSDENNSVTLTNRSINSFDASDFLFVV